MHARLAALADYWIMIMIWDYHNLLCIYCSEERVSVIFYENLPISHLKSIYRALLSWILSMAGSIQYLQIGTYRGIRLSINKLRRVGKLVQDMAWDFFIHEYSTCIPNGKCFFCKARHVRIYKKFVSKETKVLNMEKMTFFNAPLVGQFKI